MPLSSFGHLCKRAIQGMSWFVCTVSRNEPSNWEKCKSVGLWGLTRTRSGVVPGDRFVAWIGGRGFIAEGEITGSARRPVDKTEAPWPGGTYRFSLVVPIRVQLEVKSPVFLPFDGQRQRETGISKAQLQSSLSLIPDVAGQRIAALLAERHAAEVTRGGLPLGDAAHAVRNDLDSG
jgi:hypothetical protein